jgi:hypothetical protein
MRRRWRWLVLVALAGVSCTRGSVTLVTEADDVQGALGDLRRTAERLCPGQAYRIGEPQVTPNETQESASGGQPKVTVKADLVCPNGVSGESERRPDTPAGMMTR